MNRLKISRGANTDDLKVFGVDIRVAGTILPALRSDYFIECSLNIEGDIKPRELKFLMHVVRLLTEQVFVI